MMSSALTVAVVMILLGWVATAQDTPPFPSLEAPHKGPITLLLPDLTDPTDADDPPTLVPDMSIDIGDQSTIDVSGPLEEAEDDEGRGGGHEARDPQAAANPAQSPSPTYNNGLYTPWSATAAAAATPAKAAVSSAAAAPAAVSSAASAPSSVAATKAAPVAPSSAAVSSSSAAAASAASSTSSAPASAASSVAVSASSPSAFSASSSPYTSWLDAPPPPTTWRLDMTLTSRPLYTATLSPSSPSSSGSASLSSSSSNTPKLTFKPVYLAPLAVILLLLAGWAGWFIWRRKRRARSVYSAEAELWPEKDDLPPPNPTYPTVHARDYAEAGPKALYNTEKEPEDEDTEHLVKGWKEWASPSAPLPLPTAGGYGHGHTHTLSYSSTDIFGEETPLPPSAAAPGQYGQSQVGYGYGYRGGYGGGYGYAAVPDTPSKPRPFSSRQPSQSQSQSAQSTLYRTASRLLQPVAGAVGAVGGAVGGAVRRPSWFRPPPPRPQAAESQGRMYGPRVPPPRVWGHPTPAAGAVPVPPLRHGQGQGYDDGEWAHPAEREEEERVRGLLFARREPMGRLEASAGSLGQGYTTVNAGDYASHQQQQQRIQQYYAPTPRTVASARSGRSGRSGASAVSSPSVYSLASPPPVPVRTLGRGRSRKAPPFTVEEGRMEGIGEGEEDDVPRGVLGRR